MSSSQRHLEIRLKNHANYFSLLPIDKVTGYLNDAIAQNSPAKGEYKSLLMRIDLTIKQTANQYIKLQASESDRIESFHLKQLTSFLVASKHGAMFCNDCNKETLASDIIFERYIRETTTGKRFYCKAKNHLILDLIDLKRAGEKHRLAEDFAHLLDNIACEIN